MTTPPLIRPRTTADIPSCITLLEAVYATDSYPVQGTANASTFLNPSTLIQAWVATTATTTTPSNQQEPSDQIIGHVSLSTAYPSDPAVSLWLDQQQSQQTSSSSPSPSSPSSSSAPTTDIRHLALLERLFTHPSHRSHGTASALLSAAVQYARRANLTLVMFALVKDEKAIRLYRRCGWREFGRRDFVWVGEGMAEGQRGRMEGVCFVAPEEGVVSGCGEGVEEGSAGGGDFGGQGV